MIEQHESADGAARVALQTDGSGHYRYVLSTIADDAGWTITETSHLYGWRGPCLHDAKRALQLQGASGVES